MLLRPTPSGVTEDSRRFEKKKTVVLLIICKTFLLLIPNSLGAKDVVDTHDAPNESFLILLSCFIYTCPHNDV